METTSDIQQKVAKLYAGLGDGTVKAPPVIMAGLFVSRARSCIRSAFVLEKDGFQHWQQTVQLFGLAVELALKACLYSVNISPPHGHDLNSLCLKIEAHGFKLDARDTAIIAHLHHHYFQDLNTGTRHKSRYPTETDENLGGVVPTVSEIEKIIERLQTQLLRKQGCADAP